MLYSAPYRLLLITLFDVTKARFLFLIHLTGRKLRLSDHTSSILGFFLLHIYNFM